MSARSTPASGVAEDSRLSLNDAQSYLATAEDAFNCWYAQRTTDARTYVADRHEEIHFIDELLRERHRVGPR